MKIATWNVNSVRSRLAAVIDWLETNPVDVLCLQETKVVDADFPREPFLMAGYQVAISGQKSYNGVAIITREPSQQVLADFGAVLDKVPPELDAQKRVITSAIADFWVVNLYVPNGSAPDSEKYDYKLRWLACLKEYLEKLKQEKELCVVGDFNIALENIDIYKSEGRDTHIMSTPPERAALREILDIGLQDSFRKFTTEGGHFSWWDYRAGGFARNRGWRIDHIYLTPGLYERATDCVIDKTPRGLPKPSDHTPVIVTLN
ncbi:MAG: exodeoxyribonuclease III [Cyanobacteria bacterium P01_H01_bin.15]